MELCQRPNPEGFEVVVVAGMELRRRGWNCGGGRDGAAAAGMELRRRGSRRRRAGEGSTPTCRRRGCLRAAGSCHGVGERVSPGQARKATGLGRVNRFLLRGRLIPAKSEGLASVSWEGSSHTRYSAPVLKRFQTGISSYNPNS